MPYPLLRHQPELRVGLRVVVRVGLRVVVLVGLLVERLHGPMLHV